MRRTAFLLVMITSILFISACSNKNLVTSASKDEDASKDLGSAYGFTSFNLVIDTKEMKEALKVDYDEKRDKTEAMYESKIDNLYLHGDKAMEKLEELFEELSLNPEMDDEDMIKEASETFEIVDYKSLALQIKFKGHDKKELKMTK